MTFVESIEVIESRVPPVSLHVLNRVQEGTFVQKFVGGPVIFALIMRLGERGMRGGLGFCHQHQC